jgi:dTDP-4-dehydrorhamnose 3,5-epimerase
MTDEAYSWVGARYRTTVSTQSYNAQTRIDGVTVIDLPLFGDEGGDFCEVARIAQDGNLVGCPGFRPEQVSYSYLEPGAVKAWHLHRRQEDFWFVPPHDRMLVGLLDTREGSPTYQMSMRFVLGAGKAKLLLIPRGVAHGMANLSGRPASVFYFANNVFSADNPDEHRLPHDLLGDEFWSIIPG